MFKLDVKKYKPPYLVHSDTGRMFGHVREKYSQSYKQLDLLELHFILLCEKLGKDNLIIPSFNYDFPKAKIYDPLKTLSQVGSLSNHIIENNLLKRTTTPIFSFLTNIPELLTENYSPFSIGSLFDRLHEMDGTIIFYGAKIDSCTYLHFIEEQFGPPLYRYQKEFTGKIINNGLTREVKVEFHVRPMGLNLDYDWNTLNQLLIDNDVVTTLAKGCFAVKVKDLSAIWGTFFKNNQFDILSEKTKKSIIEKYKSTGRRFVKSDFEVFQ
jgi:aminoglycoside N3'-acetyltransferase